jgi:hypothetical protein
MSAPDAKGDPMRMSDAERDALKAKIAEELQALREVQRKLGGVPPLDPNLPPEMQAAHDALFEPPVRWGSRNYGGTNVYYSGAPGDAMPGPMVLTEEILVGMPPPAAAPTPATPSPAPRWRDRLRSFLRR